MIRFVVDQPVAANDRRLPDSGRAAPGVRGSVAELAQHRRQFLCTGQRDGILVDQDGEVLDILVQPRRRNKQAAKKFLRKLMQGLQYVPRVIITDQLRSYRAAKAEVMPSVEHRQQKA